MQPIAVYDTNVLISGMMWGGVPYRCIELAQQGKVQGVTCDEILNEFTEKLSRYSYSPTCYLSRAFPMKSLYGVVYNAMRI